MVMRAWQSILTMATVAVWSTAAAQERGQLQSQPWQDEFAIQNCNLLTTGRSQYFVMEPGFRITLEGDNTKVEITVLEEMKVVNGVNTRVVEEREWKDGKLYEVAKNYFAMCESTKDVFYFGEDVEFYENGKVVKNDGSWHAGEGGNRPGLIMPGSPQVGMKYYQEIAPGVAMDRAEIVSISETCKTPAGTFSNCLRIKEGTALDPGEAEFKMHAPGIGLVRDEDIVLTRHGKI
jgi:hypothetical protein